MDNDKNTADRKVILCPNAQSDVGFVVSRKASEILKKNGRRPVFCPVFDNEPSDYVSAGDFEVADLDSEVRTAEMIITFGGDGTILRVARAAAVYDVPILGVNLGGKGFLTELDAEEVHLIELAFTEGFRIGSRMMLDVEVVRDGEIVCRDCALNDVVIKGDNKVIDLTLLSDGKEMSHFSGDGAVIATPTGSTAYSMAAGGPIVEPRAHNIIITPVCAHILEAKAFVLTSDRRVSVQIGKKKRNPAYMSVDGGEHTDIQCGDIINARKSVRFTHFVRLSNMSFYKKVSEKLGERR